MPVSKEGKKAPEAKQCSGWEEEKAAAFADQVIQCVRGKQTLIVLSDFWPIKGKLSQVHCDFYFYTLAD